MHQRSFGVELFGRHCRRDDQLDPTVIEHIDQQRETPRFAGQPRLHLRHIRQQQGVKLLGDFEVVVLRSRAATQCAEIEPDDTACTAQRTQLAVLDVQQRILITHFGQLAEGDL